MVHRIRSALAAWGFLALPLLIAGAPAAAAEEKIGAFGKNPPLLSQRSLPPPRENPASNIDPQPDYLTADAGRAPNQDSLATLPANDRPAWLDRKRSPAAKAPSRPNPDDQPTPPKDNGKKPEQPPIPPPPPAAPPPPAPSDCPVAPPPPADDAAKAPPTPESVEAYRCKLERRLLERYNNLPDHAGKVAKVAVVLSRPLEYSMDNRLIRAEFDQVVYDHWGKRLPSLEKEYYVVTFGSGGAEQVRSDPSVRVGLDLEKTYSERMPPVADPFRNVPGGEAFKPTPPQKMPHWWRPEFPELD